MFLQARTIFRLWRVSTNQTFMFRRLNSTNRITVDSLCEPLHPLLQTRVETMTKEFSVLEKQMSSNEFDQDTVVKFSSISSVLDKYHTYQQDMENLSSLLEIINEDLDAELVEEANEELKEVVPRVVKASSSLKKRLLPPIVHSNKPAILELRPGVGGSEAALFTQDLLNMYINFANYMSWPYKILSESHSSNGFLNEAIISIDAPGAYNVLRHESGVHRVQRIPATESKGRIHTSTAAVVVLPKMSDGTEQSLKEDERSFAPGEIRIDTMRSGGKGGQHVNTTDSAVRIVHIPTGIMVVQQDERSQPKNKAKAFSILRSRLAQMEREKEIAEQKKLRSDQVTTTDRSDKIRTYNYPQNRVTDHRCNYSVHDLPGFMAGPKLEEMIEKMDEHEFEERLQMLIAESKV
ncbi:Peptide chain release factor 1, mitochondrial [Clavispora lusitaniae]|uniref:Peptide chain release factor 1, mitochondrial n=1 Tax=Clavispora lusitaniae (strain ATCC 42720) TaxID=306902 RepID=C4Y6S1_CLAL4|nr:uncharacterized protein CLUG_03855 [Clavispora lusitaniae ATCC 42720]EEQ39727.1 hypothetical protein CLUG_03855 [Clavispora lusitaniae ATCC 42720]KAF7582301.1 Peptide chain release factor 1, mitochondrial [Clavispora lusitaniae]